MKHRHQFRTHYSRRKHRGKGEPFCARHNQCPKQQNDITSIVAWLNDRYGKKGSERDSQDKRWCFNTAREFDEDDTIELKRKLRNKFMDAQVETREKQVRVRIIRNDRPFREMIEAENRAEEEEIRKAAKDRRDRLMVKWKDALGSTHFLPHDIHNDDNGERTNDEFRELLDEFVVHKARCTEDPEYRLNTYLPRLREILPKSRDPRMEGGRAYGRPSAEPKKNIYVLRVKSREEWPEDKTKKAEKCRVFPFFPFDKYPEIDVGATQRECVYVGLTSMTPENRWDVHIEGGAQASKIAKLKLLYSDSSFEECHDGLNEKYGFYEVGWRDNGRRRDKNLRLESWLGWALYKAGYWVWGPDYHKENPDFFGSYPFL
tara:strand:+ start:28 stop:1149 length:1122 start_codon:yes stop_codon:yes gene_type:complete